MKKDHVRPDAKASKKENALSNDAALVENGKAQQDADKALMDKTALKKESKAVKKNVPLKAKAPMKAKKLSTENKGKEGEATLKGGEGHRVGLRVNTLKENETKRDEKKGNDKASGSGIGKQTGQVKVLPEKLPANVQPGKSGVSVTTGGDGQGILSIKDVADIGEKESRKDLICPVDLKTVPNKESPGEKAGQNDNSESGPSKGALSETTQQGSSVKKRRKKDPEQMERKGLRSSDQKLGKTDVNTKPPNDIGNAAGEDVEVDVGAVGDCDAVFSPANEMEVVVTKVCVKRRSSKTKADLVVSQATNLEVVATKVCERPKTPKIKAVNMSPGSKDIEVVRTQVGSKSPKIREANMVTSPKNIGLEVVRAQVGSKARRDSLRGSRGSSVSSRKSSLKKLRVVNRSLVYKATNVKKIIEGLGSGENAEASEEAVVGGDGDGQTAAGKEVAEDKLKLVIDNHEEMLRSRKDLRRRAMKAINDIKQKRENNVEQTESLKEEEDTPAIMVEEGTPEVKKDVKVKIPRTISKKTNMRKVGLVKTAGEKSRMIEDKRLRETNKNQEK